jgi:CheY-like chemotaxis protein
MTAPIRVLVADDEKNLRELLVRELSRKGHAAEGVADGQAALTGRARIARTLVLDMRMPRVEGIEVLRAPGSSRGPAGHRDHGLPGRCPPPSRR